MKNNSPKATSIVAIKISNLSKSFSLPTEGVNSIKNLFINTFKKNKYKKLDILRNIDFEIKEGDFFGIVGRNGSGKSTLLKLIAGIYTPDKGSVSINGRLTPFIELGVGFNPELTGKENVYLNGALLGLSRKEVKLIYDDIVDFAELDEFMDQKLKNYSSGMQVRLAFSIAIQSNSEILLFDEVLAVGDASFQRKCFDKFEEYKRIKKTIILVTHDMGNVRKFCNKALLIHDGNAIDIGDPNKIAAEYEKLNQESIDGETEKNNNQIDTNTNIAIELKNNTGKTKASFVRGEKLIVKVDWKKGQSVKNVGVAIMKESGEYMFGRNTFMTKRLDLSKKTSIEYEVDLNLGYGRYYLSCGTFGKNSSEIIDFLSRGPSFIIKNELDSDWEGLVYTRSKWID